MSLSDFWKRLSAAAEGATSATPLGLFFDSARQSDTPEQASGLAKLLHGATGALSAGTGGFFGLGAANNALKGATASLDPNASADAKQGFSLLDAAHAAYDYGVNRPLGTVALTWNKAITGQGSLLDGSVWRKSYNQSDKTSLGQAYAGSELATGRKIADAFTGGAFSQKLQSDNLDGLFNAATAAGTQQQRDFMEHNPLGRILSGTQDLAANVLGDPLLYAGKGVKVARLANTTFKTAAARDAALELGAGNITEAQLADQYGVRMSKRIVKSQTKMDQFISSTRGMNKSQLMQLPQFRDTGDAGAIAYWFERADKAAADDAEALATKRDIFGVVLGNQQSIDRLAARKANLLDEMNRMSQPVDITNAEARFTWNDYGQGMYDFLNAPTHEALDKVDAIDQEIARLDRLQAIRASTDKFGSDMLERFKADARTSDLHESIIYDGMAGKPVRIVRGTVGKAAPNHINAVVADEGHDELRRVLGKANMPADVRAELLDQYASAPTREGRVRAVQEAERQIFATAGARYGKTAAEINKLLEIAAGRRAAVRYSLRTRLYSAAPDAKYIMHTDEGGYLHAFDRPFLQSQLDDMVPITDPAVLEKVLKQDARTGFLKDMMGAAGATKDVADQLGMVATRVWKDMQLFRVAYPLRIQVDTQMRLMASLGSLQYAATAARGFRNMLSNHNFVANDLERLTGTTRKVGKASILARPETAGTYVDKAGNAAPILIQPALNADSDLAKLARTLEGHTYRDLVMADTNANILRQLRATGDFDIVKGGDPNWASSYMRAVNKQIRNSPTAMAVLSNQDDHAVAELLRTDPAMRAEWRNFASEYDGDPVPWVGMVRAHVNHNLPTPELQATALERPLTAADLEQHFGDVTLRPPVHGEVYVPFMQSPIRTHWENARQWWYKFASDAPETIMGRHPLYNARFRQHMREAVARYDGQVITENDVAAMRKVADRKARIDMSKTLFDVSDTSNLAHLTRFVSPFFAAWEDTMMKWGQLLYDDPSRAVRIGQAWTAPGKADITMVDDQGQEFVILPGMFSPVGSSGWRIRKDSFNIVFQGEPWWLPGFGPLVQVPTNEIVKKSFPDMADDPVMKYVLPYGVDEQGVGHQLVPAWVRKAKAAFSPSSSDYAQTYALLMAQEMVRYNKGERKTKPTRDEIMRATRNWHLMRALTSFGAPVSADPTPRFQFYIDQAHAYRDQDQQIRAAYKAWQDAGSQGDAPPRDWQEKFYQDYPDYFEMSVSLSKNNTGIVASDKAFAAIKKYRKQIAENPEYGWYFVGPDNNGDFSQGVYAFQKSQSVGGGSTETFRGRKDPAEAIRDAEASKGWMDYRKGMTLLQVELEARGLHSFQQRGAEDLLAAKRAFISGLSSENPNWATDFGNRNETKAEDFLRMAKANLKGDFAKRPDNVALAQYLEARALIRDELKRRGAGGLPAEDSVNSANRDLRVLWDQFTSTLVANNMGFEQMWQRALEADQLNNDI